MRLPLTAARQWVGYGRPVLKDASTPYMILVVAKEVVTYMLQGTPNLPYKLCRAESLLTPYGLSGAVINTTIIQF